MGKLSNVSPYKGGDIPQPLQKWLDILFDSLKGDLTLTGGNVVLNGITTPTGCIPSNGTDATNDIDFSTGVQRDSSNIYTIRANSDFTKRADATWASGTGNGGMATGSFSATTDYHLHLLGKSTDPTAFDYIFDTSATCVNGLANAAVVAAGFDIYKRVASLRTGGSAAWPTFSANEIAIGQVQYLIPPVFEHSKSWSGADNTEQTATLASVPGGIKVLAIIGAEFEDATAGASSALLISSFDVADTAANSAASSYVGSLKIRFNTGATAAGDGGVFQIRTSTNRTFRYRGVGTSADHSAGFCSHGWIDSRL